jgi:uncharacterized protein (TIGR02099 family)
VRLWLARLLRGLLAVCASLIIALALLLGLFRLLVPQVPEYQNELEAWAMMALGVPVSVGRMDARLTLRGPELTLYDATVGGRGSAMLPLAAREVSVVLSVRHLLVERVLAVDRVYLSGVVVDVARDEQGGWLLQGQRLYVEDDAVAAELPELPDFRLLFEDGELRYQPSPGAPVLRFTDLNVQLARDGQRVTLDAQMNLPATLGSRLAVSLDAQAGDAGFTRERLATAPWNLFADLGDAELAGWKSLLAADLPVPEQGHGNLRAWLSLRGTEVLEASADVDIADLVLPQQQLDDAAGLGYDTLVGRLEWHRHARGWTAAAGNLRITRGGHTWPETTLRVEQRRATDTTQRLEVQASYLRLQDLLPAVAWLPDDALRRRLLEMSPSGMVTDLSLEGLRDEGSGVLEYEVSGRLNDLRVIGVENWPGVEGLSGRFRADQDGGRFELVSNGLAFERRPSFAGVVSLGRAQGLLVWRRSAAGWRLVGDDVRISGVDLTARGHFELMIPDDGEVFVDVRAEVIRVELGPAATRFLPVGHMPAPAVNWLRRGFPVGELSNGSFELSGRPGNFPFQDGDGHFSAEADLRGATLDYANGWPVVTDISGRVRFDGARLEGLVTAGTTADSRVRRAEVAIDNLRRPTLTVSGEVDSSVDRLLAFLRSSRAGEPLGEALYAARGEGRALTRMELVLPLFDVRSNRWRGTVDLDNARLGYGDLPHEIESLRGRVVLDNGRVSSEDLVGTVLGDVFTAELAPAEEGYHTRVRARGRIGGQAMLDNLGLALPRETLLGATEWSLTGLVPQRRADGTLPPLRFTVDSSLQGLAIDLPSPVGKLAAEARPFALQLAFTEGAIEMGGTLGEQSRWLLNLLDREAGFGFVSGNLHLGGGPALLPLEPGLVIDGRIDDLPIDPWLGLVRRLARDNAGPAVLRRVELQAGTAVGLGQQISDLSLQLTRGSDEWRLRLDSEAVAGDIIVPFELAGEVPVIMNMQRLVVAGANLLAPIIVDEAEEPAAVIAAPSVLLAEPETDPRTLPPIRLLAEEFGLAGMNLGRLELELQRSPGGLTATRLSAIGESFSIEGTGSWIRAADAATSVTQLVLKFASDDVAATLRSMRFEPFMVAAGAEAEARLQWPGTPYSDGWRTASSGDIGLSIRNGRLSEVEPGAGRVVGLMSLTALPRRLALDFRDVFGRGLGFDSIAGNFILVDGDAYTDNLRLRGPTADVALIGRTGLAARDYMQQALVTADVGMALPAVGGLLAGPGVAAAILVFQEVFRQPMRGIGQVAYCVTGPWEAPSVVRMTGVQNEGELSCIDLPADWVKQP